MKRRLIAAVVASAFAAPAMAQLKPVPGFEWQVYGRVYLTVEQVEAKGGTSELSSRTRVSDNSSLLGIKAEKDLGGGLKGWGQLETGFKADDTTGGTNSFATRNSGVGLQGSFGNFFFGRWDTPFKISQVLAVDPFGDLTIAAPSGVNVRQAGFDNRANNIIQYWSPVMAGFQLRLGMTSNEGKSDAPAVAGTAAGANPRLYSGTVEWTQGPFYASIAYEKHKDSIGNVVATQGTDETGKGVSAKYTLGAWQLSGQYGVYDRTGTENQKSGAINLMGTFGVHQAIVSYRTSKDGGATTATTQPECKAWALGYKYLFDRNLDFIALITQIDNNTAGLCDFGQNAVGAAAIAGGGDPKGVAAGLRYTF